MFDLILGAAIIAWCFWALPGSILEYKLRDVSKE